MFASADQHSFDSAFPGDRHVIANHPSFPPRIDYSQLESHAVSVDPPGNMTLWGLHVSGKSNDSYDLTFFADGCGCSLRPSHLFSLILDTEEEETKFLDDARRLTNDIVSQGGPMYEVSHLLNIWGVFVPSRIVRSLYG